MGRAKFGLLLCIGIAMASMAPWVIVEYGSKDHYVAADVATDQPCGSNGELLGYERDGANKTIADCQTSSGQTVALMVGSAAFGTLVVLYSTARIIIGPHGEPSRGQSYDCKKARHHQCHEVNCECWCGHGWRKNWKPPADKKDDEE